jgi:hypothetical protein
MQAVNLWAFNDLDKEKIRKLPHLQKILYLTLPTYDHNLPYPSQLPSHNPPQAHDTE